MHSPNQLLAFWNIGTTEIIVIGVVMLLLFGNRLPEVMRSMGKGVVEFKRGLKETQDEISRGTSDSDTSNAGTPARKTAASGVSDDAST